MKKSGVGLNIVLVLFVLFNICCSKDVPNPTSALYSSTSTESKDNQHTDMSTSILSDPSGSASNTQIAIVEQRSSKDYAFKHLEQSPIPEETRNKFQGLNYYPVDLSFRFICKLEKYNLTETVNMFTSKGENRTYKKYGVFKFDVGQTHCELTAFKSQDKELSDDIFIPFKDITNGKETYGAGRYLELKEDSTDTYVLDFNQAFNPYCAYNSAYSCPIPPQENTLGVSILAGEKKFH